MRYLASFAGGVGIGWIVSALAARRYANTYSRLYHFK